MGTRADFYVGRGRDAQWIGSIAWDGYPSGITPKSLTEKNEWPTGAHVFEAKTEGEFVARVEQFFANRDDVTRPVDGWPWPWEDSHLTDYSYAFDDGLVWRTAYGPAPRAICAICGYEKKAWVTASEDIAGRVDIDEEGEDLRGAPVAEFPDMRGRNSAVLLGPRSGVILLGRK